MTITLWPTSDWLGKLRQSLGRKNGSHDEIRSDNISDDKLSSTDETSQSVEADEYRDEPQSDDHLGEQTSTLAEFEVGQMILVRVGRKGTQRAEVISAVQVADDNAFITVRKYRAKSGSWTKPLYCYAHQIIGPVAPDGDQAPT